MPAGGRARWTIGGIVDAYATDTATRHAEWLLRWVFLLGRLAPLSQAVLGASEVLSRSGPSTVLIAVFAFLAAESVVLAAVTCTAVQLGRGPFLAIDLAAGCMALIVGALVAHQPSELSWLWSNLLYVVALSAIVLRDTGQAMTVAGFWLSAHACVAAARFGIAAVVTWRDLWQAMALVLFMALIFTLSHEYVRINARLDRAREHDIARERMLAAERERGRHFRLLHDRVLQTMETLGRGQWLSDPQIRTQVAAEASWLRQLISGELTDQPDGLNAALASVISGPAAAGLTVELHAGHPHPPLSAASVEAVAGATGEALTNVRKHAGVEHAVVSIVACDGGVLVTVVDNGRGFRPARASDGLGIRHCMRGRMHQVAGVARLDSAPGRGTQVELWAPASSSSGQYGQEGQS